MRGTKANSSKAAAAAQQPQSAPLCSVIVLGIPGFFLASEQVLMGYLVQTGTCHAHLVVVAFMFPPTTSLVK